jgi:hypothetical protein
MNHIVLLSEKKEEDVQKKNVSSVVKGTCQLMKQGQFVCLVNYQFKQGKIEQNLYVFPFKKLVICLQGFFFKTNYFRCFCSNNHYYIA